MHTKKYYKSRNLRTHSPAYVYFCVFCFVLCVGGVGVGVFYFVFSLNNTLLAEYIYLQSTYQEIVYVRTCVCGHTYRNH